jgi:isoleucyl-tRNA synthetase
VILADATHLPWLEKQAGLICDELNVKRVEFTEKADQYITYNVLPDLKRLGPRLGKRLPAVRKKLGEADGGELLAQLERTGKVVVELPDGPVELDSDDIQVRLQAKEGWAAAQGTSCVVVLSTELTEDLIAEGYAREIVHAIQNIRKSKNCRYTDRLKVRAVTGSEEIRRAMTQFGEYIKSETLTLELALAPRKGPDPIEVTVAGHPVTFNVQAIFNREL